MKITWTARVQGELSSSTVHRNTAKNEHHCSPIYGNLSYLEQHLKPLYKYFCLQCTLYMLEVWEGLGSWPSAQKFHATRGAKVTLKAHNSPNDVFSAIAGRETRILLGAVNSSRWGNQQHQVQQLSPKVGSAKEGNPLLYIRICSKHRQARAVLQAQKTALFSHNSGL